MHHRLTHQFPLLLHFLTSLPSIPHSTYLILPTHHINHIHPALLTLPTLDIEVTTNSLSKFGCEITDNPDMEGNVVLFGSACESERVPLEVRDFGAAEENVLTRLGDGPLFLDLELEDIGWVLNDLGDVGPVTGADLSENTFDYPNKTANEPIAL